MKAKFLFIIAVSTIFCVNYVNASENLHDKRLNQAIENALADKGIQAINITTSYAESVSANLFSTALRLLPKSGMLVMIVMEIKLS